MRVPDPEDPKYHVEYKYFSTDKIFDYQRYVEDFRKWKAELQQRFKDIMTGPEDPWIRMQKIWNLLKEILGEETS